MFRITYKKIPHGVSCGWEFWFDKFFVQWFESFWLVVPLMRSTPFVPERDASTQS